MSETEKTEEDPRIAIVKAVILLQNEMSSLDERVRDILNAIDAHAAHVAAQKIREFFTGPRHLRRNGDY